MMLGRVIGACCLAALLTLPVAAASYPWIEDGRETTDTLKSRHAPPPGLSAWQLRPAALQFSFGICQ